MKSNLPLLIGSVGLVGGLGTWALIDPDSTLAFSQVLVARAFEGRGWFIVLTVTALWQRPRSGHGSEQPRRRVSEKWQDR